MGRQQRAEAGGLLGALIAAILSFVTIRGYLQYAPSQWLVSSRIFFVAAGVVAICAIVAFIAGYSRLSESWSLSRGWFVPLRRLFEVLSLSVVYGATVFLSSFVVLSVINTMIGIQLGGDYLVAIVVGGATIMGYFGYVQGELLTAKTVASLLPLFVLSGVGTAGLTTDDPNWWHNNFSQLGDNVTFAASMFNLTLVLAGVCVIIISYFAVYELLASHQQYVTWRHRANLPIDPSEIDDTVEEASAEADADPDRPSGEELPARLVNEKSTRVSHFRLRTRILMVLLALSGISLAGVGVFRYTPHPLLHDLCARGMMLPMCLLLISLPWLAPQLSKMVFITSDLVLVIISVYGIMWVQGQTTLTNVEAITWILFMAWFIVFSRQVAALEADRVYAQLKYDGSSGEAIESRLSPNK
ncbi:MAG: ABC transporter permease [Bifidobacteriaceae bacterium]|jgi:hypothetical membrane protein|nr:ABC transporter permease [Bifidobacteriaceae bacterium]